MVETTVGLVEQVEIKFRGVMKKGKEKFKKVMKEFKKGDLHSGSKSGPTVKKLAQAKAIAFSEDRKADKTAKGMKKAKGMKNA